MADSGEQRQTEKVEAARLRAAAAARGEIARVTMDARPQQTRSRYNTGASVPTTPTNMISDWATNSGGNDQGPSTPASRPDDKPAERPRKDR